MRYDNLIKLNQQERINQAKKHHTEMLTNYPEDINDSITHSKIYTRNNVSTFNKRSETKFVLVPLDTVSAIYEYKTASHCAIMNFASFNEPGGLFMKGSKAQEEALAHESILYEVLSSFQDFYDDNQYYKNKGLYDNRAIYSPLIFDRDNIILNIDVLTLAFPNRRILDYKPNYFTAEENTQALTERIRFARDIFALHNIRLLITGAAGCGVFKQDPYEVAKLFIQTFSFSSCDTVIFAIPPGPNYLAFQEVMLDLLSHKIKTEHVIKYFSIMT